MLSNVIKLKMVKRNERKHFKVKAKCQTIDSKYFMKHKRTAK